MPVLNVGVWVDPDRALRPWESTLVAALRSDDRFSLYGIVTEKTAALEPSGLCARVLAADAALFARAWTRPGDDAVLTGLATLTPESAGDVAVIVKFSAGPPDASWFEGDGPEIWTLGHLADAAGCAAAFGFAEAATGAPLTSVSLVRFSATPGRVDALATARTATKASAARNAAFVHCVANQMIVRELARRGVRGVTEPEQIGIAPTALAAPGLGAAIVYGLRLASFLADRALTSVTARLGARPDMWTLSFGRGEAHAAEPDATVNAAPPRGRLWADPFLFEHGGALYVFFEDYVYADDKAHISVGRLADGRVDELGEALRLDTHLSYPFVFRDGDAIYMVPENHQANRLEVWRCVEFPLKWELHATALEGRSPADTTFHKDGGDWWVFTNLPDPLFPDHCSMLHVFKVDGPDLKRVEPHRLNPVVIDAATARNGGRFFSENGRLYRPSQRNVMGRYGAALNLMEIRALDLERYEERLATTIEPGDGFIGCHHFDKAGDTWVIDRCRRWGGLGARAKTRAAAE